jgi:hypothetical protein
MWIIELLACSCSCHLFFFEIRVCAHLSLNCHEKIVLGVLSFFVIVAVECINSLVILLFNLILKK